MTRKVKCNKGKASTTKQPAKSEGKKKKKRDKQDNDNHLNQWLAANGLERVLTIADGNCLFRALSDQLFGHQNEHSAIRHLVADYIEQEESTFKLFMDEADGDIAHYCNRMRRETTWGGQLEIQAFSLMKGVNVLIHQTSMLALEFLNWPLDFPCVQLAYQEGEHYDSVQPTPELLESLRRVRKRPSPAQTKESLKFRDKREWLDLLPRLMTAQEIRQVSGWGQRATSNAIIDDRESSEKDAETNVGLESPEECQVAAPDTAVVHTDTILCNEENALDEPQGFKMTDCIPPQSDERVPPDAVVTEPPMTEHSEANGTARHPESDTGTPGNKVEEVTISDKPSGEPLSTPPLKKPPRLTKRERKRLEKARKAASRKPGEVNSSATQPNAERLSSDHNPQSIAAGEIRPVLLQC